MRYKNASNDPIRPPLFIEQIVHENGAAQEGGVQGDIGETDELRARVDELARRHEVRGTMNIPHVRNANEPTQTNR